MSFRRVVSHTPMMLLPVALAFALPLRAQSLRKALPTLLDGRISLDQIVEAPSKEPDAAPKREGLGEGWLRTVCESALAAVETKKRAQNRADEATKADPRALVEFWSRINLATAAGAKVKRIVVLEWVHGWGNYPTWSDVAKEIQTAWAGRIESMYPGHAQWSELPFWNVFASIEFDNSPERGCIVTDGLHVSMRDVNGEIWLTRLVPTR
jgi:hypothetical protein